MIFYWILIVNLICILTLIVTEIVLAVKLESTRYLRIRNFVISFFFNLISLISIMLLIIYRISDFRGSIQDFLTIGMYILANSIPSIIFMIKREIRLGVGFLILRLILISIFLYFGFMFIASGLD